MSGACTRRNQPRHNHNTSGWRNARALHPSNGQKRDIDPDPDQFSTDRPVKSNVWEFWKGSDTWAAIDIAKAIKDRPYHNTLLSHILFPLPRTFPLTSPTTIPLWFPTRLPGPIQAPTQLLLVLVLVLRLLLILLLLLVLLLLLLLLYLPRLSSGGPLLDRNKRWALSLNRTARRSSVKTLRTTSCETSLKVSNSESQDAGRSTKRPTEPAKLSQARSTTPPRAPADDIIFEVGAYTCVRPIETSKLNYSLPQMTAIFALLLLKKVVSANRDELFVAFIQNYKARRLLNLEIAADPAFVDSISKFFEISRTVWAAPVTETPAMVTITDITTTHIYPAVLALIAKLACALASGMARCNLEINSRSKCRTIVAAMHDHPWCGSSMDMVWHAFVMNQLGGIKDLHWGDLKGKANMPVFAQGVMGVTAKAFYGPGDCIKAGSSDLDSNESGDEFVNRPMGQTLIPSKSSERNQGNQAESDRSDESHRGQSESGQTSEPLSGRGGQTKSGTSDDSQIRRSNANPQEQANETLVAETQRKQDSKNYIALTQRDRDGETLVAKTQREQDSNDQIAETQR
ncbi:hypothetical protein BDK51DRAFT_28681 [Blyttiomyces helicus]|uniref:Uncharacterized protein n=1 Tax=Blyttiomyces helicus TaxID=388810 RepID=A0A4P9WBR6_9FUNG|nr:hypothetical protein BDK51DRAFT_28681 [Blyttiomyces helicus]|eukprot:RKO89944.1 hypothetical protein BDK51DRAFT_28681 [Blyttiomyces helicus]